MSDTSFDNIANDFQPDAAALEEASVPLTAHVALYVVLLMLIVAVVWSILGTVDRIVVAPGKIMRYFTRTPAAAAHPAHRLDELLPWNWTQKASAITAAAA